MRGWLATAAQLYGSPKAARAAAGKLVALARKVGLNDAWRVVMRKLRAPTMPVEMLVGSPMESRLAFEDRWIPVAVTWSCRRTVSMVVLTKGNQALLDACLNSVASSVAAGAMLDVVVVNNGSDVVVPRNFPFAFSVMHESPHFNWSAFNNRAVKRTRGEFVIFLNDDVEALHGGWLDAMLDEGIRPSIGAVGAKLLYPSGLIQHIEVQIGLGDEAGHVAKFEPRTYSGPNGKYREPFTAMAVTGACLLTNRRAYDAVGGFDEDFPFNFNDVDYCLRLRKAGFKVRVTPLAELVHLETATRQLTVSSSERARFHMRWDAEIKRVRAASSLTQREQGQG